MYGYTTIYLSIYHLMDIWVVSILILDILIHLDTRNIHVFCVWTYLLYSLHIPRSKIDGSYVNSMFNILGKWQNVFQSVYTIYILTSNVWGFPLLTSLPKLVIVCLLGYSHPIGYQMVSHCAFDFHFPVTNDVAHLFMTYLPFIYLLQRIVCSGISPILKWWYLLTFEL